MKSYHNIIPLVEDLTKAELLVYLTLNTYKKPIKKRNCEIAEITKLNVGSVSRCLKNLANKGYIEIEYEPIQADVLRTIHIVNRHQ